MDFSIKYSRLRLEYLFQNHGLSYIYKGNKKLTFCVVNLFSADKKSNAEITSIKVAIYNFTLKEKPK